jgi:hypothetical protein
MIEKLQQKNQVFKNFRNAGLLAVLTLSFNQGNAQSNAFPFDALSPNFNVTLNVQTNTGRPFNNKLLGTNVDVNVPQTPGASNASLNGAYTTFQGFNAPVLQNFLKYQFDPVSVRFPQGVFANVYHWEDEVINDTLYVADSRVGADVKGSQKPLKFGAPTIRLGYQGLKYLHNLPSSENGGFDILTVLNINNHTNMSSGRRIDQMRADGFDVRDVELGNEFFWGNQRSNGIATEQAYVTRAKSVVTEVKRRAALAGINNMKFSIPISPQRGLPGQTTDHTNYNTILTADKSYYDAISAHKYLEVGNKNNSNPTADDIRYVLTARKAMNQAVINEMRADYGTNSNGNTFKEVWLTEWGVSVSANNTEDWATTFLGIADTYLYLIENDDKYKRVNWFSVLGANAMYKFTKNPDTFTKTGTGAVYEIMRDAFKNTRVYDCILTAPQLKRGGVNQGVKAVSARIVKMANNKLKVVAVNLSNQTANFYIKFNGGSTYSGNYSQSGIRFGTLGHSYSQAVNMSGTGSGMVSLQPYSITVISDITPPNGVTLSSIPNQNEVKIKEINTPVEIDLVVYPNPSNDGVFKLNTNVNWTVFNVAGAKVTSGKGNSVDISASPKGIYILKTKKSSVRLVYQ